MDVKKYKDLVNKANEINNECQNAVREILANEKKKISFDWNNCDAPSIASQQFDEDITDAYITDIWLDGGMNGIIKVNLHAYYLGEDREDIDLNDEIGVDWSDILDYLI